MRLAFRHVPAGVCLAVLVLVLAGCEASPAPSSAVTPSAGPGSFSVEIHGANSGAVTPAAAWPKTAPAVIPGFPGQLDSISGQREQAADGTFGVRMQFSNVAVAQFWTYLAKLRGDGFGTRGVVYYAAGESPADAQARADRGDFDAVQASRPPYVITISVPAGSKLQASFDIEGLSKAESDAIPALNDSASSGGPDSEATPSGNDAFWPAEWSARVPAPSGCLIDGKSVTTNTASALVVSCTYPDADAQHHQTVAAAYAADLQRAGFTKTGVSSDGAVAPGGVARIQLTKGSLQVSIRVDAPGNAMLIAVVDMGA